MTELEKAAQLHIWNHPNNGMRYPEWDGADAYDAFVAGAEWQAKQSQWIRVKDRLPDFKDGLVNVRCKNKNKEDGIWLYDICYIDEDTNTWGKRHHTWETITHWMPIPE